jgi:hypothetical protein
MKKILPTLVSALLLGSAANSLDQPKWLSLFNGDDLTDWTVRGKATWSVQDDDGRYEIRRSADLTNGWPLVTVTNTSGTMQVQDAAATNSKAIYRAVGLH